MPTLDRIPNVVVALAALILASGCQQQPGTYDNVIVEAACGQCQFDMAGDSCDLAVRIDGEAWFVDGTGIDDHGNAHGADGFCNAVRQARVSGHVEGDRFVATAFELLPADPE